MKQFSLALTVLISLFHLSTTAQDMTLTDTTCEGNFQIDSTFTRDGGKKFEVSVSGETGLMGALICRMSLLTNIV